MKVLHCLLLMLAVGFILLSCAQQKTLEQLKLEQRVNNLINSDEPIYLAHNLWYKDTGNFEAINFKEQPFFLPAGTEIEKAWFPTLSNAHMIIFRVKGRDEDMILKRNGKYQTNRMKSLDILQIFDRTFTMQSFEQLTNGLKDQEVLNIKRGTIQKGMSKKAVLISWGYPPFHRNPDLAHNEWHYWRTRTQMKSVLFDENDRVIKAAWFGKGGNEKDTIE